MKSKEKKKVTKNWEEKTPVNQWGGKRKISHGPAEKIQDKCATAIRGTNSKA